jgi:hypothetical protein
LQVLRCITQPEMQCIRKESSEQAHIHQRWHDISRWILIFQGREKCETEQHRTTGAARLWNRVILDAMADGACFIFWIHSVENSRGAWSNLNIIILWKRIPRNVAGVQWNHNCCAMKYTTSTICLVLHNFDSLFHRPCQQTNGNVMRQYEFL